MFSFSVSVSVSHSFSSPPTFTLSSLCLLLPVLSYFSGLLWPLTIRDVSMKMDCMLSSSSSHKHLLTEDPGGARDGSRT